MEIIFKKQKQNTIDVENVDLEKHIIVAVHQLTKTPCILNFPDYENKNVRLYIIGDIGNYYSGYSGESTAEILKSMSRYHTIACFDKSDWKSALQWLIDNA